MLFNPTFLRSILQLLCSGFSDGFIHAHYLWDFVRCLCT
jgi:hypothetical protein